MIFDNYITFDGTPSSDFGIFISGTGTYDAPERDVTVLEIPGRSGNLVYDNGRYRNIDVIYPAFLTKDFKNKSGELRSFLLTHSGNYYRLTDTYHADEFRMARYSGGVSFDIKGLFRSGETSLLFDCKPQRFLASGDNEVTVSNGGSISNPTGFDAKPLIRVYGTGTISVGEYALTITEMPGSYTDIDCDIMEAYCEFASCNEYISLQGNEFPVLHPGANGISWTGSISQVKITPRWWQI